MTTITPWSRVISEKQKQVLSYSRYFPHFMEPKGSLHHSQQPATCPYPEPYQYSQCPHTTYRNIRFNIILPSTPVSSKWEVRMYSIRVNEENATRRRYSSPLPYASYINSSKFLQHKPTRLLLTYFMSRPATCREEHLLHRSLVSWDHLACKSLRSREGNAPAFQRYRLINMAQAKAIVFTTLAAY
jgi:hypothetical protein